MREQEDLLHKASPEGVVFRENGLCNLEQALRGIYGLAIITRT
jgi:hypothetical protein